MSDELLFSEFNGLARLFPLPNLVLFPHVVQPLHIFEPRYRQMMKDALAADRLLTIVLLKPGWEASYEERPPIHAIGCLGRIHNEQLLEDGKYNLLLSGVCRIRIEHEVPDAKLYRSARVTLLPDQPGLNNPELQSRIIEMASAWVPARGVFAQQMRALLEKKLTLGALCDLLAFALPLPVEVKQELLEELDVRARARRLAQELEANPPAESSLLSRARLKWPLEFSPN